MRGVVLALVCAACAEVPHGPAVPPLPGKGGPAWVEVTSPHFVMWTDVPVERGRELVRELEHHWQIVMGVSFNGVEVKIKSFVIALRDHEEVAAYRPPQFAATAFLPPNPLRQPIVLIAGDTNGDHTMTHELTHVITYAVVPHQPRWFAEGIAGYFETAKLGGDGAVDIGNPLDHVVARLHNRLLIPSAQLFSCHDTACIGDMFYVTTWALFSFLVNVHPAELTRYLNHLAEVPGHIDDAWHDVFPDLPPDKLDRELDQWLVHGRRMILHYRVAFVAPPMTDRPLDDADALAVRGLLHVISAKSVAPEARGELDAALALDHANLVAALAKHALTHVTAVDDARALTAAHPDDWRAWWLLGLAAGPDAPLAHDKLCALVGSDPPDEQVRKLCAPH